MSTPSELFRFCPRCGTKRRKDSVVLEFSCDNCGLLYYFNPTLAVASFLQGPDDRLLFIRRAKEPARGKLAVPGGFVDIDETAEDALRREIREEVNLDVKELDYLCSATNKYLYREVTYPVLDLFFVTRAESVESIAALDEVESYCWLDPQAVDEDEIAFPSIREGFRRFRQRLAQRDPSRSTQRS